MLVLLDGLIEFVLCCQSTGEVYAGSYRLGVELQDAAEHSLGLQIALLAAANDAEQGQSFFIVRFGGEYRPENLFGTLKIPMC